MKRRIWRPRIDEDVEDELRLHLELREGEYRAAGMSAEEARERALRQFGDVEEIRSWLRRHEVHRRRRTERIETMDALLQDVRYAARKAAHDWRFSLAVVVVLALGIGATTTMFSAVDAALLRPLPFADDQRLVVLPYVDVPDEGSAERPKSSLHLDDVGAMSGIESLAAHASGGLNFGSADRPRRVRVALVTPDFFRTLGTGPLIGRAMNDVEGTVHGARVAVLSYDVWRREFGGDATALGQTLRLNGTMYEVVGVMPRGFGYPDDAELWLPLRLPFPYDDLEAFPQFLVTRVIARLAPGVSAREVGARILAGTQALRSEGRALDATAEDMAVSLREDLVGERANPLFLLLGATGFVLLIACANATNLLLSRAAVRRPEFTLRAALGATRSRLLRQLLVESILLALAAGALGVAIAHVATGMIGPLLPNALVGVTAPRVDLRVLGVCLGLALATGVAFGVVPALRVSRSDAAVTLKAAGSGGIGARGGARVRRALVVAELALALVLAVGAGLMLRTLQSLLATDLGLRPERVATAEVSLPSATYDTPAARERFQDALLTALRAQPGVEAAGVTSRLPLRRGVGSGMIGYPIAADGQTAGAGTERVVAEATFVSADYFRAMGISMIRGRSARPREDSTAVGEIVISESVARALWPGGEALGARALLPARQTRVVVGVVTEVRSSSVERTPEPQIYLPIAERPSDHLAIVARGVLPTGALVAGIRSAVRAVDPLQPVYNERSMEQVVATAVAPRRMAATLIGTFGLIAMLLAATGVYAVLAYGVSQRRREIGLRRALGAQSSDVLRLVIREGTALAALGMSVGLAGAWALRRVMESLVYGITPSDALTFAAAPIALFGIALLATFVPARSATRIEAMEALRE